MNTKLFKLPVRLALIVTSAFLLTGLLSAPASADDVVVAPGEGLYINNYWNRPMTLNIAFQQISIAAYSWGFMPLAAGNYDISANVMGDDNSEINATVHIPPGKAVRMAYARRTTFFVIDIVPPVVVPVVPQPANVDPNVPAWLDTQWHSIDAKQALWYRFELFSHDDAAFRLFMPNSAKTGVGYEVYSADQISRWWTEAPRGIGNLDEINQTWGITTNGATVWYVRVINTNNFASGFQFTYNGPLVNH
jgi:hypothetical protein